jgi:hypothetical protein
MATDDIDRGGEPRPLTGLDAMFANTNIVLLVLFGVCCNGLALILGVVGLITCKDPKAKKNATIVIIVGGIMTILGLIAQFSGLLGK